MAWSSNTLLLKQYNGYPPSECGSANFPMRERRDGNLRVGVGGEGIDWLSMPGV